MKNILIFGAGKIGSILASLLAESNKYNIYLADKNFQYYNASPGNNKIKNLHCVEIDVANKNECLELIKNNHIDAIVSCLPYHFTIQVAHLAKEGNTHYFDLTEDVDCLNAVKELSKESDKAYVTQCGLAPGFINIIANDLIQRFDQVEEAKLCCGALPETSSNPLQYALNWSTDGLINEYGNTCAAIVDGEVKNLMPLENLEEIQIDGLNYEAFNTSGGIGSMIETYQGKIQSLSYKTIRYPGHCEKMRFLMNGLKLNDDRETLKKILENAIPISKQDVVIVYIAAKGFRNKQYLRDSYVKKFYPIKLANILCSAIQASTVCGVATVLDIVLSHESHYKGRILQENFTPEQLYNNPFGQYFKNA